MGRNLTFSTRKGEDIETAFDDLASLRIRVFRDFPYLYEGSLTYEKEYLETYARTPRSFLFAVYDGRRMVGATTCIPLEDESGEVIAPFRAAGMDIPAIFYFGESILLKEYRGLGLGHRFFDEREAHVRSFGTYRMCCFCAVERESHHPARPPDYRPNDLFWIKRGYTRSDRLKSYFEWPDLGETHASSKPMVYWTKTLSPV